MDKRTHNTALPSFFYQNMDGLLSSWINFWQSQTKCCLKVMLESTVIPSNFVSFFNSNLLLLRITMQSGLKITLINWKYAQKSKYTPFFRQKTVALKGLAVLPTNHSVLMTYPGVKFILPLTGSDEVEGCGMLSPNWILLPILNITMILVRAFYHWFILNTRTLKIALNLCSIEI